MKLIGIEEQLPTPGVPGPPGADRAGGDRSGVKPRIDRPTHPLETNGLTTKRSGATRTRRGELSDGAPKSAHRTTIAS